MSSGTLSFVKLSTDLCRTECAPSCTSLLPPGWRVFAKQETASRHQRWPFTSKKDTTTSLPFEISWWRQKLQHLDLRTGIRLRSSRTLSGLHISFHPLQGPNWSFRHWSSSVTPTTRRARCLNRPKPTKRRPLELRRKV